MSDPKSIPELIMLWPKVGANAHRAMAEDLEVPESQIRLFKMREWIPPEYWEELVHAASRRRIKGVTYRLLARLARERAGRVTPKPEEVQ